MDRECNRSYQSIGKIGVRVIEIFFERVSNFMYSNTVTENSREIDKDGARIGRATYQSVGS